MIRTGTATATATTAWVTAVRMCATRARSTALASTTTSCTSGGPGSEGRGVLAATKAAQVKRGSRGIRARGRSGSATPYGEPTGEADR